MTSVFMVGTGALSSATLMVTTLDKFEVTRFICQSRHPMDGSPKPLLLEKSDPVKPSLIHVFPSYHFYCVVQQHLCEKSNSLSLAKKLRLLGITCFC